MMMLCSKNHSKFNTNHKNDDLEGKMPITNSTNKSLWFPIPLRREDFSSSPRIYKLTDKKRRAEDDIKNNRNYNKNYWYHRLFYIDDEGKRLLKQFLFILINFFVTLYACFLVLVGYKSLFGLPFISLFDFFYYVFINFSFLLFFDTQFWKLWLISSIKFIFAFAHLYLVLKIYLIFRYLAIYFFSSRELLIFNRIFAFLFLI